MDLAFLPKACFRHQYRQVFWLTPLSTTFPSRSLSGQWFMKDQKLLELTAAGTAPDFPKNIREHRIPVLTVSQTKYRPVLNQ